MDGLDIREPIEMCATSPARHANIFEDSTLFHFRGVLRFEASVVPLPAAYGVGMDAWIPFSLQLAPDEAAVEGSEGVGSIRVERDQVPSAIYSLVEGAGWNTVAYTDNPNAPTGGSDRVLLQVAYPEAASAFEVDSVDELDRDLRLKVVGFVPTVPPSDGVWRTFNVPCMKAGVPADLVVVTLAEGSVEFHTRPAFWEAFYGFTVLAEGEVEGFQFEVDSYWDLEYATNDFGTGMYNVTPLFAVRFPEPVDDACILVVDTDPAVFEPDYRARLLDCEHNTLRQLDVESVDVVLGGGENRW